MRYFSIILFICCLSPSAGAQQVIPLYQGDIPCGTGRPARQEQNPDNGLFISDVGVPALHHYAPVPRMASGGAVLIVPGGGYTFEAWDLEGVDIANRITAAGFHAFILRHRLPGRESGACRSHVALDDARRGMRLVRSFADSLGIESDKVAVMGFSAGGHLAGSASVHPVAGEAGSADPVERYGSRPDRSLLIYPVLKMDAESSGHAGTQKALLGETPDPDLLQFYHLPGRVDSLTPPTLLVHASDDMVVPVSNSLRYYEALVKQGVPADLRVFASGGHGFGSAAGQDAPMRNWITDAIDWLRAAGW